MPTATTSRVDWAGLQSTLSDEAIKLADLARQNTAYQKILTFEREEFKISYRPYQEPGRLTRPFARFLRWLTGRSGTVAVERMDPYRDDESARRYLATATPEQKSGFALRRQDHRDRQKRRYIGTAFMESRAAAMRRCLEAWLWTGNYPRVRVDWDKTCERIFAA